MAEITKINIDGVVYDITGDTAYVENETLVISKGTSEGGGSGEAEIIFEVALTGVTFNTTTGNINIPNQSVAITEEQYNTIMTNKNVVIKAIIDIESQGASLFIYLKPFTTQIEGADYFNVWYGFFQATDGTMNVYNVGLKCIFNFNSALIFENIGLINEGSGGSEKYYIETTMNTETGEFSPITEIVGLDSSSEFFQAAKEGNLYLKVNDNDHSAEIPLYSYFDEIVAGVFFEKTLYFFKLGLGICLCLNAENGNIEMTLLCYDNKTKTLSGIALGETPSEFDKKILENILGTTNLSYNYVNIVETTDHKVFYKGSLGIPYNCNIDGSNALVYAKLQISYNTYTFTEETEYYTLTPAS